MKKVTREHPVLISDGSSLHDFGGEAKVAELIERIRDVYCVDVRDVAAGKGRIADILGRIGRGERGPRAYHGPAEDSR